MTDGGITGIGIDPRSIGTGTVIGEIGQEAGGEEEDVVVAVVVVAAVAEEAEGNKIMLGVRLIIGMARVWNE
jgi:hypothetical protein